MDFKEAKTVADFLIADFENEMKVPPALDRVRAMSGEDLAVVIDLFGMIKAPRVSFLALATKHSVHHRGQLSTYLRPMGGRVPGIYGPSADSQ